MFRGEKGVPISAIEGEASVPAIGRDSVADTPQGVLSKASDAATDVARRCMITQRYNRDQTAETKAAEHARRMGACAVGCDGLARRAQLG